MLSGDSTMLIKFGSFCLSDSVSRCTVVFDNMVAQGKIKRGEKPTQEELFNIKREPSPKEPRFCACCQQAVHAGIEIAEDEPNPCMKYLFHLTMQSQLWRFGVSGSIEDTAPMITIWPDFCCLCTIEQVDI
jgi:hypothetical protein